MKYFVLRPFHQVLFPLPLFILTVMMVKSKWQWFSNQFSILKFLFIAQKLMLFQKSIYKKYESCILKFHYFPEFPKCLRTTSISWMMKLINETHVTSLHVKHVITSQNQIRKKNGNCMFLWLMAKQLFGELFSKWGN